MVHYTFAQTFRTLYDKAVKLYSEGRRGAETFFNQDESRFLAANGITAQHLYDYAEDHCNYGEPGFEIALGVELIRRDYFLNAQSGKPSAEVADSDSWPAKSDSIRGIEWLPRILPKVRAKLWGELPASMMYCCGGDRNFFQTNDIHPVEFINLAWRAGDNDQLIIDWVMARRGSR
ncbi:MAG: DUF5069 domain-containing protein [Cephaloticoccus sp.]|nr:DUF5069 domain-containing protein [Cephaloticoccus sp.]MCF7760966.1 DUF5069 domain-containing protein [Cephaloticoccus sp.]